MRQFNMNKGNFEVKSHYKMYKAGKRWVVAGMATLSLLGGLMMVSGDASADGVDSSVAPVADSQAPAETTNNATTNSVVLSATPAPASSVSAEVSATSESSVVSSVVVSSSVASSVVTESVSSTSSVSVAVSSDASSVASQSLASSVVVPADAVTVKDTESEKAYALGTTPDAETTPDSAVTAVPMNAAYTSSTKAKSASVPAVSTSGTIAASSYVKTDSAQNHTSFSYSGSAKVSSHFNQTGDITGDITTKGVSTTKNDVDTANNLANTTLPEGTDANGIYWKALTPNVKNEAGTLSYESQLDVSRPFEIKGGYRLGTIVNGVFTQLTSGGGQGVGLVMAPVQPKDMGTTGISSTGTLNNNDAITGIKNAVIAGRDLYVNNAGDINTYLVHIRQTDATGTLYGKSGSTSGKAGVQSDGYAWATTSNGNTLSQAAVATGTEESTDTNNAIKNVLTKGVFFDYNWTNPVLDKSTGLVTAKLTYSEYSDLAMTQLLGTVTTNVTVNQMMAVGLFAAQGTRLELFYGGISYFQGTNATADVNVSYKFGKNDDTLLPDTKVNAVVGENIKITDAKTTLSADTGMSVTYVAPDVPGFKIDPSSVMSAIAGSGDLAIKYVVNQDDFTDQVTNAKTALQAIDDSIADLQAMIDKDPSSIDVQSVLTKMQDIRKQAVDKIAALQTIADGSVDLTTVADVQDALQKIMQGANDVSALATDASNQIDLAKEITKNSVAINKNISDDNDVMTAKSKINDDIASGQTAEDIANDKVDLENKVGIATQNRKDAITTADTAVAANTIKNALVDGAKSALSVLTGESDSKDDSHTKTDIDAGVKNLAKVSEVDVPKSVMNVQDVIDAIAKVTDLLTKDPTNTAAIDQALQGLKDKITQAKQAVASAGSAASAVANAKTPVNVSDQNQTALNQAKQHLQAVVDDANSTTDDIANAQQAVTDELKKLTDARDAEIVKGKTVAATTVPDNAIDQTDAITQLQKDQDALTTIMNNGDSTLKDIQAAEQKVAADLGKMADVVTKAKSDANKVVTDWNDNSNLYTDQTDALATIQGDIDHLNSVMKNGASTASNIIDAQTQLQNDIKKVTDARDGSVANGNDVVTGLTDQQKKDALVADSLDELHTAIAGGTKSAIDTAIDKVKTAVDTMIDADINDVPAVVTAKQKIADLPQGDTVDMDEVAKATSALKQVAQQATDDLAAKKQDAAKAKIPANLQDQFGKLDADTQKQLTDEVADLTTAAAKDGVKVSELQPKLDQLQHDLADMQKNLQTAKDAAQAVADTATPTNVADQAIAGSAYDTAKTALENTLKNDNATASDLAAAQAAVTKALQDMQDNVTTAKQQVTDVANDWAKEADKFTDQDTSAVKQALTDLAELPADATQADYTRVKMALDTAKQAVEKVRNDAVKNGNEVAGNVTKDQANDKLVSDSLGELTTAINGGTAAQINTAAEKVKTAVNTIVDSDINDVPAVVTAKQKIVDLLNKSQLDDKAIADAMTDLQGAVAQADKELQTAKANATVEEPANLDDQIKKLSPADQDKLATAVANLKDLTDPKNNGTTKASDIKAQQDIVDGILAPLQEARKTAVQEATTVATADVPANITDQAKNSTLQADKDDLQKIAADDKSTLADIQKAQQKVADDIKAMTDNVNNAKSAGNSVINKWNTADNVAKYTDQDETIKDDIATLTGLTSADNKTATQSDIDGARQKLQHDIEAAEGQRQASVTTADTAVTAVTHATDDDVKARIDAVKSAEETGTKTAIDEAVAKLQVADETVVAKNITDDKDVAGAKQVVDAALDANPYDQAKVDTAKNNYDDAVKQAESKLDAAKKQATVEEPANLLDQIGKLPKDDQAKLATAVANLKNLTDPTNNATTKVSDIEAQQDIVDGILKALQETRQNAIDTANTTVTAKVPTNIADQADKSTLQADKENLQKVAADNQSTLADIQKAQQKVEDDIADMTKKVTEAKTAGKQDVATWTDPKNVAKYTDQDTKAIDDDIAALNDLTAADNTAATQKAITDARQKLADDIAIVEQKRQAAVDDGNKEIDKAQPNVNLDDEVKLTVDGLKQAIADGTQTKIEEAIKKVQTAVDTMVATNVSDSDAVNTAKQAVNDALNATDLNTDTLNKALGDLDKAVSDAKDALATAKGKATVAEPANLDDQIKQLSKNDQDTLATAVAKLKGLTDPENNAMTKVSDIKAQQDIVDGILKPLQKNREEAVAEANGIATDDVPTNISDQADAAGATLKDDKAALQTAAADDSKTLADIKKAQQKVTDDITAMTKNVTDAKNAGNKVVTTWSDDANVAKYVDQDTTTVDADIKHLQELTSSDKATQTAIDDARKQLESDIKTVTQARQTVVDAADKVVATVNNGGNAANQDVKNRIQAVKDAESAKGTAAIDEAVSKLQNANDTVVPANVADVDGVTTAKQAVDDALNATSYDPATAAQKVADYKKAVATAKDALKQVTDAVAAIKVPANLQDQVAMDKKNKLGDLTQQVTYLQNLATQADTTTSALRPNLTDVQNRLADMTKKLHDMQADGAKLVDQFANATDDNVVKARKQLSTLLASDDATMTDIQNAMNVLKATSAPANNKPVEKQEVPVTNGQVSVPVANGDGAFVIVTDANGKQKVVQLDTADGKASANVSGAKNAQVVTVPKHGDKPFIFVTDGSGTAQYTELTPDGAKTTITPDGSKTETSTGSTIDVPAGSDVSVIYLPTADISVQAGAKNIDVPVKTGYTATVTDANGNVVQMADGSTINVEGVPAGTNYLVTYTPDPAKVVVKLGTESGFKQGESPAAGNKNAQKLTTVADALAKLQQDEKAAAAIVSTGYTDTKVNVTNALTEMNKVDENLDIDGYAHRVVAPDGKEYASLEDAVKANPTFAAGTTQMKVIYAPLDGQKIQVKDVSGKVLGTVTGKSDAEINVNDFAPIDAVLKQTAKKDNLKITVTAPDGTTYDSLSAALAATGYFDHVGLQNGASSFDAENAQMMPILDDQGNVTGYYAVLAEAASLNDMNIQDFVVSYTPAIDDTAVSVDGNHYYNNTSNKEMSDNDVDNTVNNLHNMLENGAKSGVANAINKVKTAVDQSVAINVSDSGDVQKAKQVINDILNGDNVDTGKLKQAISNLATAVAQAKQALADTKASADADGKNWQTVSPKYADQNTSAIQNDLKKLHDLTSADNTTATKTDIEQARKQLQDDIKKVDDVRQASVKTADGAVATVKNGTNDDVKNRIAAVKAAEETGTKSVIDEAVAKLQTADATVVPANVSDDAAVIAAKRAVDDALNAETYVPGDVAKAKQVYDEAVANAQATLRSLIDQVNAIEVPADVQNNAGELKQMLTELQLLAHGTNTTTTELLMRLTNFEDLLNALNGLGQTDSFDDQEEVDVTYTNTFVIEDELAADTAHRGVVTTSRVPAASVSQTSVNNEAVTQKMEQSVEMTATATQAMVRDNKAVAINNNLANADKVTATTTNTPKTDADRIHDMLDDAKVNKASINMTENASENYIGIIIASLMVAGMFGLLAAFWRRQKESEKEFQARINGDK
ncbi:KxYKxGKxW signal peptide domain-containing protein [Weissella cibaria]|uniref:KxYKxGKxW signal peptide domain-containing protein n=1 Tax=Weissella cibaria TaxID=137591 RepID=UPI00106DDE22|nr:KxYKxGKxW signal peptide domain-containing protein [Weissella cibaria]